MNEPATFEGASALVTGATGFIGSHLVDRLLERNCSVHCVVRKTSDLRWLDTRRVHLHIGDLGDPATYRDCLKGLNYVFHCAGLTRAKTRREYDFSNATICTPLYDACIREAAHLKAVVHLSSLAAVGPAPANGEVDESTPCQPITYYGKSKLKGEHIALGYAAHLPMVILRPPVVYGERETNFFTYLRTLQRGWFVKVGSTPRVLSLIYVQDLVRAMLRAAEAPIHEDNVFFVTDGQRYSWEDICREAMEILNIRPRTLVLPEGLLQCAAWFSELVGKFQSGAPLLDRQRMLDIRQSSWTASSRKFFRTYGFQPDFPLRKGLETTLDWYRKNRWL